MDDHKGFILFGKDDENDKYHDGESIMFGNSKSDDLHIASLLDIAKTYFPEDPILSKLNIRHQPEVAAFFMVEMGNVVFLNTTKYNGNNISIYGKSGMLMLPSTISNKQIESLKELTQSLIDYDLIIKTDFNLNNGMLESKTLVCMDKINPDKLIELVNDNCHVNSDSMLKH